MAVGTYQGVAGLAPRPFTLGEETGSHLRPSPPSPPPSVAAVGRRRRPTPRPSASGPVASQLLPPTGVPSDPPANCHVAPRGGPRAARTALADVLPVLRARGGRQGARGRPGPAVIGGPPCCQRRRGWSATSARTRPCAPPPVLALSDRLASAPLLPSPPLSARGHPTASPPFGVPAIELGPRRPRPRRTCAYRTRLRRARVEAARAPVAAPAPP